jgi:hypothetical protein
LMMHAALKYVRISPQFRQLAAFHVTINRRDWVRDLFVSSFAHQWIYILSEFIHFHIMRAGRRDSICGYYILSNETC